MIAIPNMEKPKSCIDCDSDFGYAIGCKLWFMFKDWREQIHPDCPLIDIVTCGECKYYGESEFIKGDMVCKYHIVHTYYTEADGFCSHGERRTDE